MKNVFSCVLAILLLANCRNEKSGEQQNIQAETPPPVSSDAEKTLDVPWIAEFNDSTQLLEIKKNPVAHPENLTEQDIIDALNLKFPEIKLEAVTHKGNIAIVQITNATYLTEEMGSTGAQAYLAEATYSLTEIKGISAVDFRFTAGDHATPGILTRESFESFN